MIALLINIADEHKKCRPPITIFFYIAAVWDGKKSFPSIKILCSEAFVQSFPALKAASWLSSVGRSWKHIGHDEYFVIFLRIADTAEHQRRETNDRTTSSRFIINFKISGRHERDFHSTRRKQTLPLRRSERYSWILRQCRWRDSSERIPCPSALRLVWRCTWRWPRWVAAAARLESPRTDHGRRGCSSNQAAASVKKLDAFSHITVDVLPYRVVIAYSLHVSARVFVDLCHRLQPHVEFLLLRLHRLAFHGITLIELNLVQQETELVVKALPDLDVSVVLLAGIVNGAHPRDDDIFCLLLVDAHFAVLQSDFLSVANCLQSQLPTLLALPFGGSVNPLETRRLQSLL